MKAERWQQVKAIFHRAVDYDPVTRAEFLRESCGNDQELRRKVEALLASDRESRSLLEHPVVGGGAMAAAAPARDVDAMIGRAIGNYVITGKLAHGGMGIVYRARHVTLPRDAVVKCIRSLALSEASRTDLRARFRREAHIQCQLDHPHIVRVYESFTGAEEYFLVMEYVHGESLRSMLDKQRVLPAEQASALAV
jgi:serine/threonine protein kinase